MFEETTFIQRNVDLQSHNTLALSATAAYFASPPDVPCLARVIAWGRQQGLPMLPIGNGSNMVLCHDFPGLVIKYSESSIVIEASTDDSVTIKVAAGMGWHDLVLHCVAAGWFGIENLALIPGNVGAAPIQNIGAYGVELCDVVHAVVGCYLATGESFQLDNEQCRFGYRDSIFKQELADKVVITHVILTLKKHFTAQLSYPVLADELANRQPSACDVMQAVIAIRKSKLPDPAVLPNAGSFFKNPLVSQSHLTSLLARFPDMPFYSQANGDSKLAAGWLIERAGWKGHGHGLVAMHDKQALVLVAKSGAKASEVMHLAGLVQADVARMFDVQLEIEPRVICYE